MTIEATIEQFFTAWNAPDADERLAAVRRTWSDDGVVKDPLADVVGHDAIAAFITEAVGRFPGHTFRPASGIDAHHDVARFAWTLVGPDGSAVVEGVEVATVAADGRLSSTVGFFGPIPAIEEVAA